MKVLLVSEGSSDRMLLYPIRWILSCDFDADWADLTRLRFPPKTLPEKIRKAIELYPCDLLIVHRDADTAGSKTRSEEIAAAVREVGIGIPWVAVVPDRMTEAWFLFDERAIRSVAGKPNGRISLELPSRDWDRVADPKLVLHDSLRCASERTGRDASKFNVGVACHQLAEDIVDFSPLRGLQAFRQFEDELRGAAGKAKLTRGIGRD